MLQNDERRPCLVNVARWDGDRYDADRLAADVERRSGDFARLGLGDSDESVGRVELLVVLEVRAQVVEDPRLQERSTVWATIAPSGAIPGRIEDEGVEHV